VGRGTKVILFERRQPGAFYEKIAGLESTARSLRGRSHRRARNRLERAMLALTLPLGLPSGTGNTGLPFGDSAAGVGRGIKGVVFERRQRRN
jgi:hypothetical protein